MIRQLRAALTHDIQLPALPATLTWYFLLLCWGLAAGLLFVPIPWIPRVDIYGNSDALFYTNILAFIRDSLHRGELFPRWFADANSGMGSPVMFFYAPLSYTITALINAPFEWLHLHIGTQFMLGIYASIIISGYTSYVWLKHQFSAKIAFIGSLMYILLPYKLIYIYLHFNLAQLWALAFLPLWMLAAEEICEENHATSPALYALALAATYYCHPLSVLAFGLIPLCYVLFLAPAEKRIPCYVRLCGAHLLAALICLWQAYPQFVYRDWIHTDEFLKGRLHWEGNFFHIDVFLCFYYGLAAILVCYGAWRLPSLFSTTTRRAIFFWGCVIAITACMTQRISNPLWEYITPLQYLQFPAARLHAGAMLGAIYLFCVWITHAQGLRPLGPVAYRTSMILICILFFAAITICRIKNLYTDGTLSNKDYLGDAQYAQIIPVPEYKTIWGCTDTGKVITAYRAHKLSPPLKLQEGTGSIIKANWEPPQKITLQADVASEKSVFIVRQCYVPLWQAVDEKGNRVQLTPAKDTGLIELALPKGEHSITLFLDMPPAVKATRAISLAALCIALGWWLLGCYKSAVSSGRIANKSPTRP